MHFSESSKHFLKPCSSFFYYCITYDHKLWFKSVVIISWFLCFRISGPGLLGLLLKIFNQGVNCVVFSSGGLCEKGFASKVTHVIVRIYFIILVGLNLCSIIMVYIHLFRSLQYFSTIFNRLHYRGLRFLLLVFFLSIQYYSMPYLN